MRHQRRPRQPAGNRAAGCRGLEDALAAHTGQLGAHVAHHLEAPGNVLQLLRDVPPNLAQPCATLRTPAGLTCRVAVAIRRLGPVHLRLAWQVLGQAAIDDRAVRSRVGCMRQHHASRCLRPDSIQYCCLQQAALRVAGARGEALARAAEHHAVAPCQLQLQLVNQQLEHIDLGLARLQLQAQRIGALG